MHAPEEGTAERSLFAPGGKGTTRGEGGREGEGGSLWREHGLRRGHLFPPRRIEMHGHAFSVPRKAEWLLDVHYGDWHTVRKCSHAASGVCPEAS